MGVHLTNEATRPRGRERYGRTHADQELAGLAKALGHSARVRIVRLLAESDTCRCGAIVDELPLAQPTVSQHLKVLKEAGVIRSESDGHCICYHVEAQAMKRLKTLLDELWPDR